MYKDITKKDVDSLIKFHNEYGTKIRPCECERAFCHDCKYAEFCHAGGPLPE